MSVRIVYSDDLPLDILNQGRWYRSQQGEALAQAYSGAVEAAIERLIQFPNLGIRCQFPDEVLAGLRFLVLDRPFQRHLLFYFVRAEELIAFRVLNGSRNLRERLLEPPETD